MRSNSFFITGLLALSACAVGPDFERPQASDTWGYESPQDGKALPEKTADAPGDGGAAQTFAKGGDIPADWWKLYHSERLDSLIEIALKNNPGLEAAEATLREADENAAADYGLLFPEVDASFSSTREKLAGASFGGSFPSSIFTLHNASVSVSYGVDLFGGVRREIESAEAQAESQAFELKAARLSLTANVVTAAIQYASLSGQIDATQKIIEDEQKQRDLLSSQLDVGAVARTALLAQETTLAQTRATMPPLEKQLSSVRHQLQALLGKTPDDNPGIAFDLHNLTLPQQLPVSLPAKLVDQRPDVRAAEANLHAASAAIGVAISNRLPGIALTGSIGTDANTIDKLFTPGGGLWSIGGSVVETVFDGGSLMHKQDAAEAAFDAARAEYRKTVIEAFQNVADVLRAIEADAKALKEESAANDAAEKNLKITQEQYRLGGIGYVALVQAEQAEQQTRLALVQAEAQRFADTAALFEALGGGWWNKPAEQENSAANPASTKEASND